MSVDKFGRRKRAHSVQGPKGIGFNLTAEGDYDMQDKRLVRVKDPVQDGDAVNLRSVRTVFNNSLCVNKDGVFNANSMKIVNLKDPSAPNDVTNKRYVDARVPELGNEAWAFKRKRLSNVADPKYDGEVVTLGYLKQSALIKSSVGYNANNVCISNVGHPANDGDAVNKGYFERRFSEYVQHRSSNFESPQLSTDAVNLDYFMNKALTKVNTTSNDWDGRYARLKYLADPKDPSDAVTKAYLHNIISDLSYAIYKHIHPNRAVDKPVWWSKAFQLSWEDMFKANDK